MIPFLCVCVCLFSVFIFVSYVCVFVLMLNVNTDTYSNMTILLSYKTAWLGQVTVILHTAVTINHLIEIHTD